MGGIRWAALSLRSCNGKPLSPNGRPDLFLLHEPKDFSPKLGLVEMKGSWNDGLTKAKGRMLRYLPNAKSGDGRAAEPFNFDTPTTRGPLGDGSGFSDKFQIKFGSMCPNKPTQPETATYETNPVPGSPGILMIDKTDEARIPLNPRRHPRFHPSRRPLLRPSTSERTRRITTAWTTASRRSPITRHTAQP